MSQEPTKHYRACHLCEAMCGVVIETQGDEIVSIKGDDNDPLSRGHICPKAVALQDLHQDPDRLRQPMRRIRTEAGDYQHEPIGWDEALDLAAEAILKTVNQYGVDGVGAYFGNPSVHNYGMMTHQNALFSHLRTRNRFSATSVDQLPHHLAAMWLYGHKSMLSIPDIDRTEYFLMFGANPLASNGSIWTVPDVRQRIKDLKARGGKLVVVDPRRTETAELASEHHFVKPGSDAAVLLAIINVFFRDDLIDLGRLESVVDGLDEVEVAVKGITPAIAAEASGIDAAVIEGFARNLARAERAICYGRMGISVQRFGTICQWATQVINILTGNLDEPGGMMFTTPAVDQLVNTSPGGFGRHRSRKRNLPEFDRELPAACLAEEITEPGDGQIKLLFTGAGNPVLSTPAGHVLDEALEQLDFMISLDPFLNETTRHADIILPPTSALEHDHYDIAFHGFAVRNTARYNPPVFDKPAGAMHDWEIFEALGKRVAEGLGTEAKPSMAPHHIIDFGLQNGPYGKQSEHNLSLQTLIDNPSGVDLGPLESRLPERLFTAEKRINIAVAPVLADLPRLAEGLKQAGEREFLLIGRRHVRDNNSWMHNSRRLVKGKPRCTLLVNPQDAEEFALGEGDLVRVESDAGAIVAPVQISDAMMPGVVSLPHGYGHDLQGVKADIAKTVAPGVSCNNVTDLNYLDDLSGNAAVNGVPVSLTAAIHAIPEADAS